MEHIIIILIFIILVSIISFLLNYIWTKITTRFDKKDCIYCKNYKTLNCPNSSLCYYTKDKPFFK